MRKFRRIAQNQTRVLSNLTITFSDLALRKPPYIWVKSRWTVVLTNIESLLSTKPQQGKQGTVLARQVLIFRHSLGALSLTIRCQGTPG